MKRTVIVVAAILAVLAAAYLFAVMPGERAGDRLAPFTQAPIAHRGLFDNGSDAPENSLAAFQRAADAGYAVELDVQMTADGMVVVSHDTSQLRVAGVDREIPDMTAAEVADLRLFGTDEPMPTLAEALDVVGGRVPLLVELKVGAGGDAAGLAEATAELLDGYEGAYAVQSFNPFALQWFKDNRPEVLRGILAADFLGWADPDPDAEARPEGAMGFALSNLMADFLCRPNFVNYQFECFGQPSFSLVRALTGVDCLAWTVKSDEDLEAARATDAAGFVFDSFEPAACPMRAQDPGPEQLAAMEELEEVTFPTGDMPTEEDELQVEELDEEETGAVERQVAAQEPVRAASLFKNKAKTYYYRSKLSRDERAAYDAIVRVCQTPKDTSRREKISLSKMMKEDDACNLVWVARRAVFYDHPELFGFYNNLEGCIGASTPYSSNGKIDYIYAIIYTPYRNYEKEMKEFNKAVDKFMKGIDLTQPKAKVALQIHDKICQWAFYDNQVLNGKRTDLGHTAYGVLVRSGYGNKHGAVCAGYAMAYLYLLQQAGIEAAYVHGEAGSNRSDTGGHAWNVVKLGSDWYETDVTWDDDGADLKRMMKDWAKRNGKDHAFKHLRTSARDSAYVAKLQHSMYNITTSRMTDFNPGNTYTYYYYDGCWWDLCGSSVHIRECDQRYSDDSYGVKLMKLAPKAKGTKWTWTKSKNAKKTTAKKASAKKSNTYVLPDSSKRKYKTSELKKFSNHKLFLARNELFAKHGCGFKNKELREFFGSKSWYKVKIKAGTYGIGVLTTIEQHNANAMLKIEKKRKSPYI
ncbi:MAG: glycerophosphodiester phosphodiesterase family protein [Coriobacteriia bacterium]|nr:glycerophosphodiester phosphodiesterase family protein [Coriobacteriia bacterium]